MFVSPVQTADLMTHYFKMQNLMRELNRYFLVHALACFQDWWFALLGYDSVYSGREVTT